MATTGMLLVSLCLVLITGGSAFCPRDPVNGFWDEDKWNERCILRCHSGFEPSSCHVLRFQRENWNHDIPTCQTASLVSGKTLVAVGAGTAAVVALPAVLAGAGFTAAGVAAGSLAAWIQVLILIFDSIKNGWVLNVIHYCCKGGNIYVVEIFEFYKIPSNDIFQSYTKYD
ncbi:uncharacterized protein LOC125665805 isoform X1 [Ostrea edulis]|uniref:uncharacterized protein LOC125665805 isoform X1 n=1 Tax=Ostrea edulis TaxID=37623 RepID=UPI0024AF1713|nr:uncharacterized protein LOC125665805 isoform X1 [Ostrea edulis]